MRSAAHTPPKPGPFSNIVTEENGFSEACNSTFAVTNPWRPESSSIITLGARSCGLTCAYHEEISVCIDFDRLFGSVVHCFDGD